MPMKFQELCRELGRPSIYVRGLQSRFELPVLEEHGYAHAYRDFLRQVIYLRALGITEEDLRELWRIEKKLMLLLHAESSESNTWFLDSHGETGGRDRRLLLSNYDLGVPFSTGSLQLGLNFTVRPPELWTGREMGEDVVRVLNQYLQLRDKLLQCVRTEIPLLKAALKWVGPLLTSDS